MDMGLQNKIALVITITVCCLACFPKIKRMVNNFCLTQKFSSLLNIIEQKYHKHIVVFILFMSAVPRLWKFGIIPAGFNQDGAMGAVDALALAQYGTDRFGMWMPVHFTAWGFGQMSVLLSYLSVPFIKIFGLNRFTARVPVLIVSLLALLVIYKLCKNIFDRKTAITVSAFLAINPWHIMQSRWALDCNMFPHFLLFSIYFLSLGLQKNKKYIYLSMLFFGVCMYAYGIAWYTVPLFLLITCLYFLIKNKITVKEVLISAGIYLLISWPIFGVMVVNFFDLASIVTPFFTIPYFPGTTRTGDILFFSADFFNQLKVNFQSVINTVILQKPDLPWNTISDYGPNYLFTLPFTIIGLISIIMMLKVNRKEKINIRKKYNTERYRKKTESPQISLYEAKKNLIMLIVIWLIVAFISGLIINNVNVNRINIIFYPMIIITGVGIYASVRKVKLFGIVVLIVYLIAFTGFNNNYFGEHSQVIGKAFFEGFGEAMEYVKDMEFEKIYITNRTQSENSWWVSEPLALFHHQVDALYYQGKSDMYSKSGKKLLPYKQRYNYVKISELKVDPKEDAVYIVHNNETKYFDSSNFDIINFAYYNVIIGACNKSEE